MDYLHEVFELTEGQVVEVTLVGNAANVLLLDEANYQNYRQGKPYTYSGGYTRTSPYHIPAPRPGRWHLVVDLGGGPGRVQASVQVISGAPS
jgi:hypothetical protein